MNEWVVVAMRLTEGPDKQTEFEVYGPFTSKDAADTWAADHYFDTGWAAVYSVPLRKPKEA
jgi:hypothetical protein